jgi:rhomboid protease GluP
MPTQTRTKICRGCGALVSPEDKACFVCGTPVLELQMMTQRKPGYKSMLLQHGKATIILFLITVMIYLVTWVITTASGKSEALMGISIKVLNEFGDKNTPLILKGQIWRLVTAIFLHANLIHIFFNMFAFVQLGLLVEIYYGWERYLFFYIFSGIFGYIASVVFYPHAISIGASGAIMGLIGVLLAYCLRNRNAWTGRLAKILIFWTVINLIIGFNLANLIDNAAHLGGLTSGFLMALPFSAQPAKTLFQKRFYEFLGWAAILLTAASFLALGLTR